MWLFKKQKKKNETANATFDKIAGKIARAGIIVQSRFANVMNKIFTGMNAKRLKLSLIIFCLGCGGYSIYLFTVAIVSPTVNQNKIKIEQAAFPKHFNKPGDEIIAVENIVDEQTFYQIQQFKHYLDSLKQNKSYLYDSIFIARPLLMDTVLMLEQIYYSQKQK